MPILTVDIVHDPGTVLADDLAQRLADEAGRVLGSAPGTAWVLVSPVPSTRYAESGGGEGAGPVFVRVLKRAHPDTPARNEEVVALTRAVADVCGRSPDRVHVIYEPPALGRVAFGGVVVR
jgi:phenylpyruvate tautomerase PptA (4-oxalocrotonate tautomerase family)